METLLKKPEIKRDAEGRFEQHGTGLKKTQKSNKGPMFTKGGEPGPRAGRGRPKGSLNKTTKALKDMILGALDEVGGVEYLKTLAIENSSAFAGLIGKILPSTIDASKSDGGRPVTIRFERVIVYPDGHQEKLLAPPSHDLPRADIIDVEAKEIKDLDG